MQQGTRAARESQHEVMPVRRLLSQAAAGDRGGVVAQAPRERASCRDYERSAALNAPAVAVRGGAGSRNVAPVGSDDGYDPSRSGQVRGHGTCADDLLRGTDSTPGELSL